MTGKSRLLVTVVALLCATTASAAKFSQTFRFVREIPFNGNGIVVVDNPVGNVEVIGANVATVTINATKIVNGADDSAVNDAIEQTQLLTQLSTSNVSPQSLVIRTALPPVRTDRWSSIVHYSITVPFPVAVKVESQMSERIRVANIAGGANVRNVNGAIVLENVGGPIIADSANGNIYLDPNGGLSNNVQLTSVNGQIEVVVAPDANFQWVGQTLQGDFRTNLPVSGRMDGTTFRGGINSTQGPTLTTASFRGNVFVLRKGTATAHAQSVRSLLSKVPAPSSVAAAGSVKSFQANLVDGDLVFSTPLGNITAGQVRGRARVSTRAGEVHLGSVLGECTVTSFGGPLDLGDIFGPLNVRTSAGDVFIRAARAGGFAATDGGMIRVLFTNAAMTLRSGGGDISIRNAAGPVIAETHSGDVTITVDPLLRRVPLFAKTSQGSVVINVNPAFAADIDATLITADDEATIRSDFAGLQVRREQVGAKTKIHVTGKVNGGGDRLELFAQDGTIQITGESRPMYVSPVIP